MISIKKLLILYVLLLHHLSFAQHSVIVLYGCSSTGKSSISKELMRILPGKWTLIASNQFKGRSGNKLLWNEVKAQIAQDYNVIIDTHHEKVLMQETQDLHILVTMLYCSPDKLIEHTLARNAQNNQKNHRSLKTIFTEYCQKFKPVQKSQPHIDSLNKETLKTNYDFSTSRALKQIIEQFFQNSEKNIIYITSILSHYDCFIDTGKLSIAQCAAKIKETLIAKSKS